MALVYDDQVPRRARRPADSCAPWYPPETKPATCARSSPSRPGPRTACPAEVVFVDDSDDQTPRVVTDWPTARRSRGSASSTAHRRPARGRPRQCRHQPGCARPRAEWVVRPRRRPPASARGGRPRCSSCAARRRPPTWSSPPATRDAGAPTGLGRGRGARVPGRAIGCRPPALPAAACRGVSDPMSGFFLVPHDRARPRRARSPTRLQDPARDPRDRAVAVHLGGELRLRRAGTAAAVQGRAGARACRYLAAALAAPAPAHAARLDLAPDRAGRRWSRRTREPSHDRPVRASTPCVLGLLRRRRSPARLATSSPSWWMLDAWRTRPTPSGPRSPPDAAEPRPELLAHRPRPPRGRPCSGGHARPSCATLDHPVVRGRSVVVGHDDDEHRWRSPAAAARRHPDAIARRRRHQLAQEQAQGAQHVRCPSAGATSSACSTPRTRSLPGCSRRVDAAFRPPEADVVQGGVQLMNFHAELVQGCATCLEYFFWFRSRLHHHARPGFIPLGGNTVFFRRDVLVEAGGWDERLPRRGLRARHAALSAAGAKVVVAYEPELATREETPALASAACSSSGPAGTRGSCRCWRKGEWRRLPTLPAAVPRLVTSWPRPFLQASSGVLHPARRSLIASALERAGAPWRCSCSLPLVADHRRPWPSSSSGCTSSAGSTASGSAACTTCACVLGAFPLPAGSWPSRPLRAVGAAPAAATRSWEKTAHVGAHRQPGSEPRDRRDGLADRSTVVAQPVVRHVRARPAEPRRDPLRAGASAHRTQLPGPACPSAWPLVGVRRVRLEHAPAARRPSTTRAPTSPRRGPCSTGDAWRTTPTGTTIRPSAGCRSPLWSTASPAPSTGLANAVDGGRAAHAGGPRRQLPAAVRARPAPRLRPRWRVAAAVLVFSLSPLAVAFHRTVLPRQHRHPLAAGRLRAWPRSPRRQPARPSAGAAVVLGRRRAVARRPTARPDARAAVAGLCSTATARTRPLQPGRVRRPVRLCWWPRYPLYAVLKGELLPGEGHVSLLGVDGWQLFGRDGERQHPRRRAATSAASSRTWLRQRPAGCCAGGVALVPVGLARAPVAAVRPGARHPGRSCSCRSGYLPVPVRHRHAALRRAAHRPASLDLAWRSGARPPATSAGSPPSPPSPPSGRAVWSACRAPPWPRRDRTGSPAC